MTTILSLILALMLSIGGSPADGPGNTGIQAPIDNSCTINRNFEDYSQKTASRPDSKKIIEIPLMNHPKTQTRLIFTLPLKEKLHLMGYEDSMNLYQAFNMNPINFTDPMGAGIDSPTPYTQYRYKPNTGFWGLTWEGSSKGMYEHGGEALAFGTLFTADAIAVPFDKALDVIDWAAQKTGVAQFFGFEPGETKEVVGLTTILLSAQPETAMVSTAARARLSGFGGKYFGRVKKFLQNILPGSKAIDKADEVTVISEKGAGVPVKQDVKGRWHDAKGRFTKFRYPENRGFESVEKRILEPGTKIDRYGGYFNESGKFIDEGTFVSPEGVPFPERSLQPNAASKPYNVYKVVKPLEVDAGPVKPWFGQPGKGIQYELPKTIKELIEEGYIIKVK
jgi:hypothetical protein